MADTGAPWNIPYAEPADLVRDWPALSEDVADAVAAGLDVAAAASKVRQIVSAEKTDTQTTTSSSFTDVTGLSVSITPIANTSVILVRAVIFTATSDSANQDQGQFIIADASNTNLYTTTGTPSSRTQGFGTFGGAASTNIYSLVAEMVHAPNTTSPFTYKVRFRSQNNSTLVAVNRTGADTNAATHLRTRSIITATEIAA
jgi:hypothetical protein